MSQNTKATVAKALRKIMKRAEKDLNRAHGRKAAVFVLTVPFGAGHDASYISNANRDDAVKALRETADRLEAGTIRPNLGDPTTN
jgi:hypothetical protein